MLVSLSIRDFVLIDYLVLEASTGFTALTGETGAGKSIILEALNLTLGGPANRQQIRHDAEEAVLISEFALPESHAVWACLQARGFDFTCDDTLILKRLIRRHGPSRSFVNDRPVSADLLAQLGGFLIERHGQHAALSLMQTATHRLKLDEYGGGYAEACRQAWSEYVRLREQSAQSDDAAQQQADRQKELTESISLVASLSPVEGEFETLKAQREGFLQADKLTSFIQMADENLAEERVAEPLYSASRALVRLRDMSESGNTDSPLSDLFCAAAEAVDRTLIELAEAQALLHRIRSEVRHDPHALERVEDRLLAWRAAARRVNCPPEELAEALSQLQAALNESEDETQRRDALKASQQAAYQAWQVAADKLSRLRAEAARRLQKAVHSELAALKLERMRFRIRLVPLEPDHTGAYGAEQVLFEIQANPGTGFASLSSTASGGELSRICLALHCALNQKGGCPQILIFDEIDQGVGGAVASAIGVRLSRLAEQEQVFAITHSPQVAACARWQWRVCKQTNRKGPVCTSVKTLDAPQRLEEIARMLSGSRITDEARAAASKLLELV